MNINSFLYGCTVAAIFLAACDNKPKTLQPDWTGKIGGRLTSIPMSFDTTTLFRTTKPFLHEDLLFVEQEAIQDNLWSLFRIQGDSLLWQGILLQKGKGPFEIQERAFLLDAGGDSLIVNPTGTRSFFTIPDHDPEAILDRKLWRVHAYPDNIEHIDMMATTTSGGFLVTARGDKDYMFDLFQPGDSLTTPVVSPYPEAAQSMEGMTKGLAYNGRIYQRPGTDRYVQVNSTGLMVTIFDLKDNRITGRTEVYNELPEFKPAGDGLNLTPAGKNRLGFRTAVTGRYIYLLDVMFKLKDLGVVPNYKGYPLGYSDQLLIFDWDGSPVARYELDTPVVGMAVAPDNSYFYANTVEPETGDQRILRFALPQIEN